MAELAVKSAAQCMGKLVLTEVVYLGSITGKVELLETELTALGCFLADPALKRRRGEVSVQNAVSDAINIAYDCEDVIERYVLKVALQGYEEYEGCQMGSIMRWACLIRKAFHAHQILSKIDELNTRLIGLRSRMQGYGITNRIVDNGNQTDPLRQFYPHVISEIGGVVGFDTHFEALLPRLLDASDHTVIVISGIGGMGKSTLARELYHHQELRGHFNAFGWASASQRLKVNELLEKLMYSLVPRKDRKKREELEDDRQKNGDHAALYTLLKDTKCLVVIDDIWTSNDWGLVQNAFPINEPTSGSRVILTTRNQDILSKLDPSQVHHHTMEALDKDSSWELFQKITLLTHGGKSTDQRKEELGREMLKHCNGVPLAIVVLAKSLKGKEKVEEWKEKHKHIVAQIQRGDAPNAPYKEVYDVLKVSYDELPFELKRCFLYLANFPEDYAIPVDKLFSLWVAEGIIVKGNTDALDADEDEDVAEGYLNELSDRNMVQVDSRDLATRAIQKCRLHDLMRDICIDIAKREGFLGLINCHRSMLLDPKKPNHLLMTSLPNLDKKMRHLAVHIVSDQEQLSSAHPPMLPTTANVSRAPNLRSLLLLSGVNEQQAATENCKKLVETILSDFPLLRVLGCENLPITGTLPEKVGNLIHLRFLGLVDTFITELPHSLERLLLLQTLDLRVDRKTVLTIPNILWMMKQLRHLYLPRHGGLLLAEQQIKNADGQVTNYKIKQGYQIKGGGMLRLDGLENLQTTQHLDLDGVDLSGLSTVRSMKKLLWAICATNEKALGHFLQCSSMRSVSLRLHAQIIKKEPMILSSCESLHILEVHSKPHARFSLALSFEMLPSSLVKVTILYVSLAVDPLPILEKLPNLDELNLHICYHGQKMACTATGFPELTHLCLDGLFNLTHWEVPEGALPKLKTLLLINSLGEEDIPDVIRRSVHVSIIYS